MGYENGKIYKLECSDGYYYIGSTTTTLNVRLRNHMASSKRPLCMGYKLYSHINEIGWSNVAIVLVEAYPCNTKTELCIKESEYISREISNTMCLTNNISFLTPQDRLAKKREYTRLHREHLNTKSKERHQLNKDSIHARQKEYRARNHEKIKQYQAQHRRDLKEKECGLKTEP